MSLWNLRRLCVLTLLLFLSIALLDAGGLDLPMARLFGDARGFAWRGHHAFTVLTHEWPRYACGAVIAALVLGIFRPWGFLARLAPAQRWQLVLSIACAMLAVVAFKRINATSCPWDLAEFGGVAPYVSHWLWGVRDLGPGHCFPAGHASAGFGFVAGWFVLRRAAPDVAGAWLALSLAAGLALGWAQQMRGAHFMSHTLWTAWTCWAVGLGWDAAVHWHARRKLVPDTKLNET